MTTTFTPRVPIWCAGCGHFGVQAALVEALRSLQIAAHQTVIVAGIGCSGTIQNNISAYGYHATHGRVLPTATGLVIANPTLMVIAAGGDGDGYAIGMGHLVHTLRRNPSMVYIVMNNATYGLTKGQPSPTADSIEPPEAPVDALQLGLTLPSSTFLARSFVGRPAQLHRLMREAITHARERRGFAFLEVLSPCVTYNDTYARWEALVTDMDQEAEYDCTDRFGAAAHYARVKSTGKIPTGVIFRGTARTYEAALEIDQENPPALQNVAPQAHTQRLQKLLDPYRC